MADDERRPSGETGRRSRTDPGDYHIRPFRPGDREAYLALHRNTFQGESTPEWFAWKYERNPFVDEVPITVAETDDEFVGAASAFPLRMHTGSRAVRVYVSCEGFVHPDHRRQGVFTRMVSTAWERYADRMAFVTGLSANEKTLSAHVKYNDWRMVKTIPRYYRFQRPDVLLESETESRLLGVLGSVSAPAVRGYFGIRAGLGRTVDRPVERFDETPVDVLTSLYRERVPRGIHAVRDETFYDWRFENPNWEYTTYVAGGDSPDAAVVVGSRRTDGYTELRVVDVQPMVPAAVESALESLLAAVLDEHTDAGLVSVLPGMLPTRGLARFGFVRQDRFPLSRMLDPIYHGVRILEGPPDGPDLSVDRLTDPSNWRLTYVEHDAS